MTENRVLVAAPWGSPFRWHRVRYSLASLGPCRDAAPGAGVESRTSLEAIVASCRPARTLIVVSDTLSVDAVRPEQSRCKGCPGNPETAKIDPASLDSYEELVSGVRERVERWISCCAGGLLAEHLKTRRLEVSVVPGFGFYAGWRFGAGLENPLSSYTGEVAVILLHELLDVQPDTMVVDLTHGINYMPVAFYQSALIATHAYTIATRKSIELIFVNSEPVLGPGEQSRIHVVERVKIAYSGGWAKHVLDAVTTLDAFKDPKITLLKMVNVQDEHKARRLALEVSKLTGILDGLVAGECRGVFSKGEKLLVELGRAAARITLYNMPLAASYLTACISAELRGRALLEVAERLWDARRVRNKYTSIDSRNKVIMHSLAFNLGHVKLALYAAALIDYVASSVGERGARGYSELRGRGLSLAELTSIAGLLGGVFHVVAANELNKLRRDCVEKEGGSCPIPVGHGQWPGLKCGISSMDKRNLRAHAGLERNIVEGKVVENELWLRYRIGGGDCGLGLLKKLGEPGF